MSEHKPSGSSNRNRNNNRQGNNQNRNRNGGQRNGGNQSNRNKNNNNRQSNNNRQQRKPAPKPLTFWQKILAIFGVKPNQAPQQRPQQNKSHNSQQKPQESKPQGNSKRENSGKPAPKTPREPQKTEVTSGRLYVGNLSYETTEYDLEDLFKGNGKVKSVEIIYNRHTHKSKGYGFIEMQNIDDAKNAVKVHHDQPFMGRNIIVNGARGQQHKKKAPTNGENAA